MGCQTRVTDPSTQQQQHQPPTADTEASTYAALDKSQGGIVNKETVVLKGITRMAILNILFKDRLRCQIGALGGGLCSMNSI